MNNITQIFNKWFFSEMTEDPFELMLNGNIEKLEEMTKKQLDVIKNNPNITEIEEEAEETFGISKDETAYFVKYNNKLYIVCIAQRIYTEVIPGKYFIWQNW